MASKILIRFAVNGQNRQVEVYPMARLLDVLREELGLKGVKEGCGEGECGACSVLLDGELVNSCLIPAVQVQDAAVTTIEGLATLSEPRPSGSGKLHPVQEAFLLKGGAQCGICTPGMILATVSLLSKTRPDEAQIREALAGNLCRCTGYMRILRAVEQAAAALGES